ncbi:MAG: hypothetical protein HYY59_07510 [Candidatus Omnitrophica bacterium]|nr:hypothetical protein [Candidatus Omnitrophota bacterium]MBI3021827.1 hypothetical protein [Candidatus Omnitrophota bacterium]
MADTTRAQERSFGLSVGLIFGLLAAFALWRGRPAVGWVCGLIAVALVVPALTRPAWLRIPSRLWWRLARALGWVNTRVLLSVFFFFVVTPTGLVMRLCGWDPLHRRRASRGSGWVPHSERYRDPKHYERMY